MGRLIVVAGLPGSGKTCYIRQELARLPTPDSSAVGAYDDRVADLFGSGSPDGWSEDWKQIRTAISEGRPRIIGDHRFVVESWRNRLGIALQDLPGMPPQWVFFANDPEACIRNIESAMRGYPGKIRERVAVVREYSRLYALPPDIAPIPVWEPSAE